MDCTGLYVHLPFCRSKCGYCGFYSVPAAGRDTGRAVRAISRELEARAGSLNIGPTTVFLGGGTPTILPHAQLQDLLTAVQRHFHDGELQEYTAEANPAGFDAARAALLRAHGVGRLSMGAQSFDRRDLAVLGRTHDPANIIAGVRAAREAGLTNLNLDLIFGIPGQTLDGWIDTLRRALDLEPEHLACYGLTYEPGTPLTARREQGLVVPCNEDLEAEMFLACIETLTAAGYQHYEISNYAKPGRPCLHHLNYWRNRPYLGIGPSAASYLDGERSTNVPDLDRYLEMIESKCDARLQRERLDDLARAGETAMLALRMTRGIDVADFRLQTGFDPRVLFGVQIEWFGQLGLLACVTQRDDEGAPKEYIRLTREGLLKADTVMADFVKPDPQVSAG